MVQGGDCGAVAIFSNGLCVKVLNFLNNLEYLRQRKRL